MMDFTMLFVCLLAFMVIQALGTYVQVQQYKKAVRRLHKKGKIVDGELMEGLTVFTKFKQIPDIIGKDIFLLKEEYEALSKKEKKQFKGHLQAVEALCNRFSSIENT